MTIEETVAVAAVEVLAEVENALTDSIAPVEPAQSLEAIAEVVDIPANAIITSNTSVEGKVLKQVEFYFGDANLPRDKFLLERIQSNEGGWISLETICTFSRMKALTEDVELVKLALSKPSMVVELNEDQTMVRRREPLPESQETLSRSLYVKGFPADVTLDELEAFFAANISPLVQAIRFRRDLKTKAFKGSVFVELSNEEEAKRCAGLAVSYMDKPLELKSKMAYFEEKNSERSGKKNTGKQEALLEKMGRGRLLKITEFPTEGAITHEALKETLKESFPVAYVDFTHESGCIWIRFREPVAETFVDAHRENGLVIGEHTLKGLHAATEEEQGKYYEASMKPRGKFDGSRRGGSTRHFTKRARV